ncbi:RHS repeat domain-containing protein [Chryseobacterium sp. S90]|uniref:RHS repeat domain-containing protein n=1 Tax=Chryseobacterium sp. S90 TaxID=3395373 RepID=UPI0039BCB350
MHNIGNTKVSFAKSSTGAPKIIDTNNYYPFGLNHISGSFSTSVFGSFYSYKYNGKELQENGMYDYGARMYMPDLGRWGTTDPLAEGFRRFSPYHYGADNPVIFIDPDGMRNVPYDGGIISNIPEGSWWFAGMNGSFTPDYVVNSGLGKRTGGGSPQTFGETQTYKDIMAYLAEPEKEYFKEIDFSQFGTDDPPGSSISITRKTWNFLADNIISKPAEGIQVVGYLFYGSFYLAPKEMIKQGKAGDMHVKMDMKLWRFKDGVWGQTLNYKDGTTIMSEKEKFNKISIPAIEAMTMGIGFRLKPFTQLGTVGNAVGNWGVNTGMKTAVKKGIYQLGPK